MERHNDMFFTGWYGVFHRPSRRLRWAGGGHPPALLLAGGVSADRGERRMLDSEGPLIGAVEGLEFTADEVAVTPGSRLFLYSDGAFEISRPDGSMWAFDEFLGTLTAGAGAAGGAMDALLSRIREVSGREDFHDDFSMVELVFG
jgi:phosphoserine phosphatase RsbU/P